MRVGSAAGSVPCLPRSMVLPVKRVIEADTSMGVNDEIDRTAKPPAPGTPRHLLRQEALLLNHQLRSCATASAQVKRCRHSTAAVEQAKFSDGHDRWKLKRAHHACVTCSKSPRRNPSIPARVRYDSHRFPGASYPMTLRLKQSGQFTLAFNWATLDATVPRFPMATTITHLCCISFVESSESISGDPLALRNSIR